MLYPLLSNEDEDSLTEVSPPSILNGFYHTCKRRYHLLRGPHSWYQLLGEDYPFDLRQRIRDCFNGYTSAEVEELNRCILAQDLNGIVRIASQLVHKEYLEEKDWDLPNWALTNACQEVLSDDASIEKRYHILAFLIQFFDLNVYNIDSHGNTLFHYLVSESSHPHPAKTPHLLLKCIEKRLISKTAINLENKFGLTPLHVAVGVRVVLSQQHHIIQTNLEVHTDMINTLLNLGAKRDISLVGGISLIESLSRRQCRVRF